MPKPSLPLKPKDNILFIETLFIGPKNTFMLTLLLDTGAFVTTIPKEVAIALGSKPSNSKKKMSIVTASGSKSVAIVTIPRIQVFGYELKNVDVACLDITPKSVAVGLLGLNVLDKFKLTLNFPRKKITVAKSLTRFR